MSSINQGTIDSAVRGMAKGNGEALRTLLNAFASQLGIPGMPPLLEPTSGASTLSPVNSTPPQASLSVSGANGIFAGTITPAAQTVAPNVWYEISYSPSANSGYSALPLTQSTTFSLSIPGATYFWRIRSSYDQTRFNAYRPAMGTAAVAAGLQTSAASSPAVPLNITNYAVVDSVPDGMGGANIRVYGPAGPGTMWTGIKGGVEKLFPAAIIIGQTLGTSPFVGYDGEQYLVKSTLPQIFGDDITPVGQVGVPPGGSVTLPTIVAVLSGGSIIGYNVTSPGANISAPLTLTITGDGTGATAGAQAIVGGALISVAPGALGTGYTHAAVTPSGGASPGLSGGGTITGNNGGRLTAIQGNG